MNTMLKDFFSRSGTLYRLILINCAVFVVLKFLYTFLFLFNADKTIYAQILLNISVPAGYSELLHKPWTLFTYMFVHEGFFHLLFNMLWLFWLGQIFVEYLNDKKLLAVYIMGGLSGAIVFILAFNLFPAFGQVSSSAVAVGASAGILAIVVATATLLPEYKLHLMFLGPVSLKWIAVVSVLLDVLSISDSNAGGHFAHLGGALFGFVYIRQLKNGNDIGAWVTKLTGMLSSIGKSTGKMKVAYRKSSDNIDFNASKKKKEEAINNILDKIAKSGYDSLSKEEKDFLFKASKDN